MERKDQTKANLRLSTSNSSRPRGLATGLTRKDVRRDEDSYSGRQATPPVGFVNVGKGNTFHQEFGVCQHKNVPFA